MGNSSQGSQGILDYRDRTQANIISNLDFLDVGLGKAWYCFDALVELVGLMSLFLFLCFELLKSRWNLG